MIDLMRFAAACYVAVFHFNEPFTFVHNWYRIFCKQGYLGVPAFFVISGYCISIAYNHSKSPHQYLIRRWFRVFPPYWCSLLVVLMVVLIVKLTSGNNDVTFLPKSFKHILATLTLLTSPFSKFTTINWVYWTLTYEVFFYSIMYLVFMLPQWAQLVFLFVISIAGLWIKDHDGPLFFFSQWPLFCIGLSLFNCINNRSWLQRWLYTALLLLALLVFSNRASGAAYLIAAILTCLLIILNHYWPLRNNHLSKMGDYSYAIYLLHVPIGAYVFNRVKKPLLVQHTLWMNLVADLVILSIIIIIAKYFFIYIELPSIKLGKKISAKYVSNKQGYQPTVPLLDMRKGDTE